MHGEEVVVDTFAGRMRGLVIEETAEGRWIRCGQGDKALFVRQELVKGEWTTTATGHTHCFFPDHR